MKKIKNFVVYAIGLITIIKTTNYVLEKNRKYNKIKKEMQEKNLIKKDDTIENNNEAVKRKYIVIKKYTKADFE